MTKKEAEFIWSLMPDWVKDNGTDEDAYDPMFFGTLFRETDIEITKEVRRILFKNEKEKKKNKRNK